jgi:aminoglycoside 3-N-acetyltransferase
MLTHRALASAFRSLGINRRMPVIAHASLSAFGPVQGGAEAFLDAMLSTWESLIMPAFTYKTMLIPETGPEGNAMIYGSGADYNRMAEFYTPKMPADRLMGIIPEMLRRHPDANRSMHPILSFAGVRAGLALNAQTLQEPLAPIRLLTESGGWVVLLGVNHTTNTSIHYAERLAGRKTFTRWALTPAGVKECQGFPSCSDGFGALSPRLDRVTHKIQMGTALVQAIPLPQLIEIARTVIEKDPYALLCQRDSCPRCQAVRAHLAGLSMSRGRHTRVF